MALKVCLSVDTIGFLQGGGHCWAYLNWALGFKSIGCRVVWMESPGRTDSANLPARYATLREGLRPYGLADSIAIWLSPGQETGARLPDGCLTPDEIDDADLFLNFKYGLPEEVVCRFRRSALIDIDPGLTQIWMNEGSIRVARHDLYFTTGERVGTPGARVPDLGLEWHRARPCVALEWWPICAAGEESPFRTVSGWWAEEWVEDGGEWYENNKRAGFLPFLDLPRRTRQRLELALCISSEREDLGELSAHGWSVRMAEEVAGTPAAYRSYIQQAKGEFSCCKPSCVRLQNAWVSDRTMCFLASGKPAVVQHTGPSSFLPDDAGMLRFRDLDSAARLLDKAAADYPQHCRYARKLAEEYFDAGKVASAILERL